MMELEQVANHKMKIIKTPKYDIEQIKGGDVFPVLYPNMAVIGMKGSGKTQLIGNILNKIVGKHTDLFFFVPTINHDPTYKEILKQYKKGDRDVITETDFINREHGVNYVKEFVDTQIEALKEEEEEKKMDMPKPILVRQTNRIVTENGRVLQTGLKKVFPKVVEEKKLEEYKPKKVYPKYVMIFDDLGNQMRDIEIGRLVKKNRHFKMTNIFSLQTITDLPPEVRTQQNLYFLLGNLPENKLENLYNELRLSVTYEKFMEMYLDATKVKFDFLYINRNDNEYRKGFNLKYKI